LERVNEHGPVDNDFSPGNMLWEFWFQRFLNRPRIGGAKRENSVAIATRIHGLKGITVLHNCTPLAPPPSSPFGTVDVISLDPQSLILTSCRKSVSPAVDE
jgi:hypothetical protein